MVILFHPPGKWLGGGFYGVDVFFVLSGFLITMILLDEHATKGRVDLRRFYVRRVLRIYPALLALSAVLMGLRLLQIGARNFTDGIVPALFYFSNWRRTMPGVSLGPLEPTWSLAIEEQFYMVWPLLLIFLLRRDRRLALKVAVAGCVMSGLWRAALWATESDYHRVYNGFDTRAEALLIGCVLALLASSGAFHRLPRWVVGVAALGGLVILSAAATWGDELSRSTFEGGITLVALAAAALITATAIRPLVPLTWLFSRRPLVAAGRISYGLYLWNVPVIRFLEQPLEYFPTPMAVAIVMTVTWLLARASYELVERPFLRLKARFDRPDLPAVTVAGVPVGS